ncbi:molybdenum ABC transporter ATP-binding protein [Ectothiorhodospiraceae bacterium 2226]|nr:molybdenum ABC transporter ATP-binding protein [Ectothiorhodospiraceae bacterium 2226]
MSGIEAAFALRLGEFDLDVALTAPGRGVTALFGHSGSGKTTVLRCMAGLERAPAGRFRVNGELWQGDERFMPTHQRPLGYVFQEASLFPHLSVRGNLDYGLRRVPAAQRRVRLEEAVDLLGVGPLLARAPDRLSGGERQRVAIARALLTSPKLLLMDEPLAALDLKSKHEILPYLERLHDELSIPMVYVSHAPEEVARLADHMVVLERGRVQAAGPALEILARLDLTLAHAPDATTVLRARVAGHDERFHLTYLDTGAGRFTVPRRPLAPGQVVRLAIHARDVSLALGHATDTTIQNIVAAEVVEVAPDSEPAQVMVRLAAGGETLLARITRRACETLDIAPGRRVYAQIKSVALADL